MPTLDQRLAAIEAKRKGRKSAADFLAESRITPEQAAATYAELMLAPSSGEPVMPHFDDVRDAAAWFQDYISQSS